MICAIKIVVFIILNRLFYFLFERSISRFLRLYSFKVFLLEVLLLEDIQKLVFLLIRNYSCLFKIEGGIQYLFLSGLPVLFGGFALIAFLILFPVYRNMYKKLSKYFLTNLYRIPGSLLVNCLLYTGKPILLSCVQALLHDKIGVQLSLLAVIEFSSMLIMWFYQQKDEIFVTKTIFCIDFLIVGAMCLINFCIYLKFVYLEDSQSK